MAKKGKKVAHKPLIFVDTNIFLDFYRAEGEAGLTLMGHIEAVAESLIITDQVENEFLKNRQVAILEALSNLKPPPMEFEVPAYLSESKTATAINKNFKQIKARVGALKKRVERLLQDPEKDPVFKVFRKIVAKAKESPVNVYVKNAGPAAQQRIFELAQSRFQRGLPPRKKDDRSIGDAINWEWILYAVQPWKRDILIVSRDNDFGIYSRGILNDFLAHEFRSKTRFKAHLPQSLSQALKMMGVAVTPAEEKEEQKIIRYKRITLVPAFVPPFWSHVLERLKLKNKKLHEAMSYVSSVSYQTDDITIRFTPEYSGIAEAVKRQDIPNVMREIFAELNYSPLKSCEVIVEEDTLAQFAQLVKFTDNDDNEDGLPDSED